MLFLVFLSGSTTSQPDYSLPNLVLMGVYVILTLVIAIAAIWSALITRSSLKTSSQLSREALAVSDRQAKDSIETINRQIAVSEKQAQEALYNQHKPIVIPVSDPSSQPLILQSIGKQTFTIEVRNKGAGVALNAFSIIGLDGFPEILCSSTARILVYDAEHTTPFYFNADNKLIYPSNMFEGVPVFPQGVFGYLRLMVTYSDIFNNKYLVVYDYSEEFGWRQIDDVRRVEQRLDELVVKNG